MITHVSIYLLEERPEGARTLDLSHHLIDDFAVDYTAEVAIFLSARCGALKGVNHADLKSSSGNLPNSCCIPRQIWESATNCAAS